MREGVAADRRCAASDCTRAVAPPSLYCSFECQSYVTGHSVRLRPGSLLVCDNPRCVLCGSGSEPCAIKDESPL